MKLMYKPDLVFTKEQKQLEREKPGLNVEDRKRLNRLRGDGYTDTEIAEKLNTSVAVVEGF